MTATVKLLAPNPFQQFQAKSGNQYAADAYGVISSATVGDILDLTNDGCISLGVVGARSNFSATVDPTVNSDNTQDYAPGSLWLNTTNNRVWMCMSNATGAATWALDGVIPGVGIDPATMLTQFGSGLGSFTEEGNIYKLFTGGTNPAATGSDYVVGVYSLPANSFDVAGRSLSITASGNFANNTNTKTAKIIYNPTAAVVGSAVSGGTAIATTGAYSTTGACGWQITANVWKYGANGSNTQGAQEMGVVINTTHGGMSTAQALTATESGAIPIAATINCATAATDASLWQFSINAMN